MDAFDKFQKWQVDHETEPDKKYGYSVEIIFERAKRLGISKLEVKAHILDLERWIMDNLDKKAKVNKKNWGLFILKNLKRNFQGNKSNDRNSRLQPTTLSGSSSKVKLS